MKSFAIASIAALFSAAIAQSGLAAVTTILVPSNTPTDETSPRDVLGDAPTGYGPDSWQGPASGKANLFITPAQLFGGNDDTVQLSQIASVTYYTKRDVGSDASKNWFFQIYTNKTGTGDNGSFYHAKFSDGGDTSTPSGNWDLQTVGTVFQQYGGPELDQRQLTGGAGSGSVADVYGTQTVEDFTLQTNSLDNGIDAKIDGLTVTLTNGDIGHVDLTAVPEPASVAVAGVGGIGLLLRRRRKIA